MDAESEFVEPLRIARKRASAAPGSPRCCETSWRRVGAWLLVAVYYFYQYALVPRPSVMMPQLTEAFAVNALGVSAIVGMFYYGYSPFSLVAGAAIDRFGAKRVIPIGAALVGRRRDAVRHRQCGRGEHRSISARCGRRVRAGRRGLSRHQEFPGLLAASFIGATQMFGMAGGSAGQFLVGPIIKGGLPWGQFWIYAGVARLAVVSACLFPAEGRAERAAAAGGWAACSGR